MYSIGEISKIVKISIDALRHYDEIGLLKPCFIEKSNGYRYYSEEQIKDLLFIIEFKQYGFSLDAIKELMHCEDKEHIQEAYETRLLLLSKEFANLQRSIDLLHKKINALKNINVPERDRPTVLIVDDVAFMRQILQHILEQNGYKVIGSACNGKEGIERYFEVKPKLVIMNIEMEEMNGVEATKAIKNRDPQAKIVICSSKSLFSVALECIKAGANDFIVKPFMGDYLLETIEKNISMKAKFIERSVMAMEKNQELRNAISGVRLKQEMINKVFDFCRHDCPDLGKAAYDFFSLIEPGYETAGEEYE